MRVLSMFAERGRGLLSLLAFCAYCLSLSAQEIPVQEYTSRELQEDWDELVELVLAVHPRATAFTDSAALYQEANRYREMLHDGLSTEQFHVLVRQWIRQIGCGHTVARPGLDWYAAQKADSKLLPMEVYIQQDRIYIKSVYDTDSILVPGMEVIGINGHAAEEILSAMYAIHPRDGYSASAAAAVSERLFRTYYLFLYGRSDEYMVTCIGKTSMTVSSSLKGGDKPEEAVQPTDSLAKVILDADGIATLYLPAERTDIAVMDIDAFGFKHWKRFYRSSFSYLEEQQINKLVIDLRNNGGGYFPNGNYLLRYLMPEDFDFTFSRPDRKLPGHPDLTMKFSSRMTMRLFGLMPDHDKTDPWRDHRIGYSVKKKDHFDGQVWVLTNGNSFSLSSYVASELQHKAGARTAGEETGGADIGSNAVLMTDLTLPHTGIRIAIPVYFLEHQVMPDETGRGVMPDLLLSRDIRKEIDGNDSVLEGLLIRLQEK
ncbi:MAG: hypothetical protein H6547_06855 [Chitinophagales bacterium]|nr:hypothetical protein [Chitinophagales bacterium]